MTKLPVILLAAGESKRMGQPKSLLVWGKNILIAHQIETLLKTGYPVIVVLGANAAQVKPLVKKYKTTIVINKNWKRGMGTSLNCGITAVKENFPMAPGAMITLLDQPFIPFTFYQSLVASFNPREKQIIASLSEKGWTGVPAVFDSFYFDEMLQLDGESGAKKIIRKYPEKVIKVAGADFLEDMDTTDIYRKMLKKFNA